MIGSSPTFTVSQFVAVFNQSLELMYPTLSIVGEVANFRMSRGTWVYFDLKDEEASVRFFGSVRRLPGPIEDGMVVEVIGRPRLHAKYGFSVEIDIVQPKGEGTITKAKDLLTEKLKKEGLFDPGRKRVLPYPPEKIALVTSSESAAYSDFVKIVSSRWPSLEIELFDVGVQGAAAVEQVVSAISAANERLHIEVLVIVRGGGSKDDLSVFDHELVVRATASSRIPTVVAIGHERDISLAELAGDLRASTPSNAAEQLVPDRLHEKAVLDSATDEAVRLVIDKLRIAKDEVAQARLTSSKALQDHIGASRTYLEAQVALLHVLDPLQPLQRGYVIVRDEQNKPVRKASKARTRGSLKLQFTDDTIYVEPKEN